MVQIETPNEFDSHSLAEFIESAMLIEDIEFLTKSEILQRFPLGQRPSAAEVEFAMALIDQRSQSLGEAYPYKLEDEDTLRRPRRSVLYDFLILMSVEKAPVRLNADYSRSDPLFDAIVSSAFAELCGPNGRALTFGWPPRDGRPSSFVEAVSWVAARMGLPEGSRDRPTNYRDAGVDIIAWQPFRDGRTGFLVYLIQNTVRTEYASKPKDVEPQQWLDWIRFGTAPVVGFAVPFSIPDGDDRWLELNYSATVFLDRTRLIEVTPEPDGELAQSLGDFAQQQLAAISAADADPSTTPRPRKRKRQFNSADFDARAR